MVQGRHRNKQVERFLKLRHQMNVESRQFFRRVYGLVKAIRQEQRKMSGQEEPRGF